ncbi:MAG TPA: glycine cleavage system aminomethyltransferase GcvT, partial [Clostridia bacterium]|nr:glycine cleavage system aminomethyltransferase GcvT [Clostridia bacterium]
MDLKTPLYDIHLKYGGKTVPFAGYLLPIQYPSGIAAEHMAVRTAAGMFDVSHMGEFSLKGPDALKNIQHLMTNDFAGMVDGQVRYSPMCNEDGGIIDDLLIYKKKDNDYLLVVNAANRDKDAAWIKSKISGDCVFEDISDSLAQIALQGPKALEIIAKLTDVETLPVKYYSFTDGVRVAGFTCLVSRTGYTGEDGYEIYTMNENAPALWEKLMAAGSDLGLIPCGLGARDTLRLEAGMPLYGHEMDEVITPLEAGLGFFVKMAKADFIGKAALQAKGEPQRERIGLEITDRGIARDGDKVLLAGVEIGSVTSGTMCPFVKKAVAMALVATGKVAQGDVVELDVRGRRLKAAVIKLPFYIRNKA